MTKMFFCAKKPRHHHAPCFHDSFLFLSFLESVEEELSALVVTLSVNADASDLFGFFFIAVRQKNETSCKDVTHRSSVSTNAHNVKAYLRLPVLIAADSEEKHSCLHNIELHVRVQLYVV